MPWVTDRGQQTETVVWLRYDPSSAIENHQYFLRMLDASKSAIHSSLSLFIWLNYNYNLEAYIKQSILFYKYLVIIDSFEYKVSIVYRCLQGSIHFIKATLQDLLPFFITSFGVVFY